MKNLKSEIIKNNLIEIQSNSIPLIVCCFSDASQTIFISEKTDEFSLQKIPDSL